MGHGAQDLTALAVPGQGVMGAPAGSGRNKGDKGDQEYQGYDGYSEFEKKDFHDCLPIMSSCFSELITGSVP